MTLDDVARRDAAEPDDQQEHQQNADGAAAVPAEPQTVTEPQAVIQPQATTEPQAGATERAVTEQDVTEPQAGAAEPDPAAPRAAVVASRFRRPIIALAAAVALLAVLGATMTVLYQRQAHARADRDRALAARQADLRALSGQLEQVRAQTADLQAKLDAANSKAIDPRGYELIKECVAQAAQNEAALKDALDTMAPPGGPGTTTTRIFVPRLTADCATAATYLK